MNRFCLLILILLIIPIHALACTCRIGDVKESFEQGDLVFSGKVISINEIHSGKASFFKVAFEAYKTYKGEKLKTQNIITNQSIGSCGYRFYRDEEYIVFATLGTIQQEKTGYSIDSIPTVTMCSQTVSMNRDSEYSKNRLNEIKTFLSQIEKDS